MVSPNIEFRRADVTAGQLEQECFDRALLVTVLGEISDRARALRAVFPALKPGGQLSITEMLPRSAPLGQVASIGRFFDLHQVWNKCNAPLWLYLLYSRWEAHSLIDCAAETGRAA